MKRLIAILTSVAAGLAFGSLAWADDDAAKCAETAKLFQDAGESAAYFKRSYGYAVFPTIGKAGLGIGGAHGSGCVFRQGKQVGTAKMTQLSIGWQLGAQGYSLLVFFEDARALEDFTSGEFEFGAKASAVAITAGASAGASTSGASSIAAPSSITRTAKSSLPCAVIKTTGKSLSVWRTPRSTSSQRPDCRQALSATRAACTRRSPS